MEWLLVVVALACPLGMLAMGAIAWAIGKRAGPGSHDADPRSDSAGTAREGALSTGA